ncbi:alpha/beta fold hydrolase [Pararhodonellum marinum]|uniref:alpha/beta fold hydrolase n=1 Tax=Pararhodonellum marinum TaxID=2755358 RepID=UPI00188FF776|nr:alpha/beta hydrolase [Pararhodonellum marinum]
MNSADWYKDGRTEIINDLSVFFKRSGKGKSLICIHGFPSSSWDFATIWPSLTERFDVMALDLIGLGKSAKPNRPLPISLQADMIEGLAVKAGITEAHIFAHDLGDTVAQELLARQFEKSSKINWLSCVFMNGGLFPETHHALFIQKLLMSPLGPFIAKLMSEKSLKKSFTKIFSKAHPPTNEFVHETWKLTSGNNGISMMPILIRYIEERRTNRERWVMPLVNGVVPIRLINGIEDPVSGKHAADRFAELVPNADIVLLENSGHYPHVETPKEVLKAFFEFHDKL